MFIQRCAICGAEFEATTGRQKYCSDVCKIEGKKRVRRAWIDSTDYNQRHREAMRLYREGTTAEALKERKKKENNHKRYLKRKAKLAKEARDQALVDAAAGGDPWARMDLAKKEGDPVAYWTAFRDYELQTAEEIGYKDKLIRVVNNIPVSDPDFVSNVIESIEQDGHISTALIRRE